MNTAIWIVQILLAGAFSMTGFSKITQPYDQLKTMMGYVEDFAPNTIKVIGIMELLGAIGVILPTLTGILPWLTPLAAVGLILMMIGAMLTHIRRGEYAVLLANLVLLGLAAFVVYGRFVTVPL